MEKVIMYSTGCPKCEVLQDLLNQNGVQFETINDVDEMLKLNITSVPMLKVDEKLLSFNEAIIFLQKR